MSFFHIVTSILVNNSFFLLKLLSFEYYKYVSWFIYFFPY